MQLINNATKQAHINNAKAKQKKIQDLSGNMSIVQEDSNQYTKNSINFQLSANPKQQITSMKYDNKLQQPPTDSTTNSNWSVNDRGTEIFELDETLDSLSLSITQEQTQGCQSRFSNYDSRPAFSKSQRPLTGTGSYNFKDQNFHMQDDGDSDYDSDFESEASSTRPFAEQNQQQLKNVVDIYAAELERQQSGISPPPPYLQLQKSTDDAMSKKQASPIPQPQPRIITIKKTALDALGQKLYTQIHDYLAQQYNQKSDIGLIHKRLKKRFEGDKKKIEACFLVDQILFLEALNK